MRRAPSSQTRIVPKSKPQLSESQGADAFGSIWMDTIKLCDQFGGIDITLCQPRIFFVSVAFPSHQILQPPSINTAIDDFLDLKPLFAPYNIGRWGGIRPSSYDPVHRG